MGEEKTNDLLFIELAEKKGWTKCPNCEYFVERIEGCKRMLCRCGTTFCYRCGTKDCWCQPNATLHRNCPRCCRRDCACYYCFNCEKMGICDCSTKIFMKKDESWFFRSKITKMWKSPSFSGSCKTVELAKRKKA